MNPYLLTGLWLLFSVLWGAKAIVIRWNRNYAKGRTVADSNKRFKYMSYFAFAVQIVVIPWTFWSDSPLLLKVFSDQNGTFAISGLVLCDLALLLYLYAYKHLGRNYSPCFDSHLPFHLVSSGPYRLIRHPGWLSKLLIGAGSFLVSGSLWTVPIFVWLLIEMNRTLAAEEGYLLTSLPEYAAYRSRTKRLIPFIY